MSGRFSFPAPCGRMRPCSGQPRHRRPWWSTSLLRFVDSALCGHDPGQSIRARTAFWPHARAAGGVRSSEADLSARGSAQKEGAMKRLAVLLAVVILCVDADPIRGPNHQDQAALEQSLTIPGERLGGVRTMSDVDVLPDGR